MHFLGLSSWKKGYWVYDFKTKKIVFSQHVIFFEEDFPYRTKSPKSSDLSIPQNSLFNFCDSLQNSGATNHANSLVEHANPERSNSILPSQTTPHQNNFPESPSSAPSTSPLTTPSVNLDIESIESPSAAQTFPSPNTSISSNKCV